MERKTIFSSQQEYTFKRFHSEFYTGYHFKLFFTRKELLLQISTFKRVH